MAIRPIQELVQIAKRDLHNYQTGSNKPIPTGKEFIDNVFGGLIPGDIVTVAGSSGGGKSFDLQRIKNFIMSIEENEAAENYVWLDFSLEMRVISNIIRDINLKTGKSKKKIISEEFTEEELTIVKKYFEDLEDGRFYIEEESTDPIAFENNLRDFLTLHKDKAAVFISVDHIALMKSGPGQKKDAVDGTVEVINKLKKEFTNTYWFIVSQLNRNILGRIKDKDVMAMPNRSDLYQSDTIYQVSDYIYVSHNPFMLGIKAFSRFNVSKYEDLVDHFCEEKGGRASFDTIGKIFYIVLKVREGGVFFKDIYIEDIGMSAEDKEKFREKEESIVANDYMPKFDNTPVFDASREVKFVSNDLSKYRNFEDE